MTFMQKISLKTLPYKQNGGQLVPTSISSSCGATLNFWMIDPFGFKCQFLISDYERRRSRNIQVK